MKTQKWVHLVDGKVSDDSHGMIFGTDWISKVTSNVATEAPTGKYSLSVLRREWTTCQF